MSDFNYDPVLSAQVSTKPRVLSAPFGDGYEQRIGDGINTMPQVWSLTFTRTVAEIAAIEAQLKGYAGVTSFTWTPYGFPEVRVICREWSRTIMTRDVQTLQCTFEQVFGE